MKSDGDECPEHGLPTAVCPCPKPVMYNLGRIDEGQLRAVINKLIRKLV